VGVWYTSQLLSLPVSSVQCSTTMSNRAARGLSTGLSRPLRFILSIFFSLMGMIVKPCLAVTIAGMGLILPTPG